ncbi:unnamed protein product [Caenorhabditis angaria]|uniref:Uncharacterized protein n=1 Tax=Caenorhabditis angaria TaxID=860376 RepID=A0A9P1N6R6_9PELO|nr:unnamed protein product [Caenorhabditis angaria]
MQNLKLLKNPQPEEHIDVGGKMIEELVLYASRGSWSRLKILAENDNFEKVLKFSPAKLEKIKKSEKFSRKILEQVIFENKNDVYEVALKFERFAMVLTQDALSERSERKSLSAFQTRNIHWKLQLHLRKFPIVARRKFAIAINSEWNRIKHLEEELMEAHRKIEILEYCLEEKTAEAIQNKDIAYGFKFEYEFMVEQNRIKEEIIEEMERQNENVNEESGEERGPTFVADETSEEKEEEEPALQQPPPPRQSVWVFLGRVCMMKVTKREGRLLLPTKHRKKKKKSKYDHAHFHHNNHHGNRVHDESDEERGATFVADETSEEEKEEPALQQPPPQSVWVFLGREGLEGLSQTEQFVKAAQKPQPIAKFGQELFLDFYFVKLFKPLEGTLIKQLRSNGDFNRTTNNDSIIQSFKELIKRQDEEIAILKADAKRVNLEMEKLKNNNNENEENYEKEVEDLREKLEKTCGIHVQLGQLPNGAEVGIAQLQQQIGELEQQLGYQAFEQQSQTNRIKHLEEKLMEAHRTIDILQNCLNEKTAEAIENKDIAYGFKFEYDYMVEQNRIKEEIIEQMERQKESVHDGSDEERGATFVAEETSEEKEEEPALQQPPPPPQSKSIEQSLLTKTHLSPIETNLIDLMNGDYEFVSVADRFRLCEYVATSAQISTSTIQFRKQNKLNYYFLYNSIDNEIRIELERLDYSKIALQSACFAAKRRNRGETLAILRKPINENIMIDLLKRVKEDEEIKKN